MIHQNLHTFRPESLSLVFPLIKKGLFFLFLFLTCCPLAAQQSQEEEDVYESLKLKILCRSARFIVTTENQDLKSANTIDCQSLNSVEQSIPDKFKTALRIFKLFKDKKYNSYGKNKLNERCEKLIKDIESELKKVKKNDDLWSENVKVLVIELRGMKDEHLNKASQPAKETPAEELAPDIKNNSINQTENEHPMFIYLILLVLIGGVAFLAYQNQQMKKLSESIKEEFQERYSRLDNRIDTLTPVKDHKSAILRINYINDQIGELMHEIAELQKRNENKLSPSELYAKRTEHLESYTFNPTVQIYYAKPEDEDAFFVQKEFRTHAGKDHFYKIEINLEDPGQAVYSVTDRSEFHQLAMQYDHVFLEPYCDYNGRHNNPSKIINLSPGVLEKFNDKWVIVKKAKITFE